MTTKKEAIQETATPKPKRTFVYILLIVLFTVVLCVDVANALTFPPVSASMGSMSTQFTMDMSGEEMTLPDGWSDSAATQSVGALYTVRSALRTAWLPILLVCLVGDILCIVLLLRARRYNRQLLAAAEAELATENEDEEELSPRRRKRRLWMIPVALLLVVALVLGLMPTFSTSASSSVTVDTEILSGTVETGTLDTVLSGTGTLTEEDAVDMTLPDTVTIETYYVSNGDTVEEGDLIATVDSVSVAAAIVNLQADLDALDEELAEAAEDSPSDTVEAAASGRVKVIYAEEDVSVIDTMYEYGALMLVSLDGLMAVDIDATDSLSVGDSVTVTLSDGSEEDGRVAQVLNGTATVTVTDEDTDYGDSATVTDSDGNTLGSGDLYIHSELKVTGYYGTVEDVEVDVDDEVDAGDNLLTLTDTGSSDTYASLLSQRADLEEQMQELYRLYMDNHVYAESAGVISGISDSAATASTDSTDSEDSEDSADSADSEDGEDSADSTDSTDSTDSAAGETAADSTDSAASETAVSTVSFVLNLLSSSSDTPEASAAESLTLNEAELTLEEGESAQLTAAVTPEGWSGTVTWASSDESVATVDDDGLVTYVSAGTCTISATADDQTAVCTVTCQEAETDTAAESLTLSTTRVSLAAGASLRLTATVAPEDWSGTVTWASSDTSVATVDSTGLVTWVSAGTCTISVTADGQVATCAVTCQAETEDSGDDASSDGEAASSDATPEAGGEGDSSTAFPEAGEGDSGDGDMSSAYGDISSIYGDMSSLYGDMSGTTTIDESALYESALQEAMSSLADSTTTEEEEDTVGTYTVGEQTILSITPQDCMTISISVDELDILSLTEGQEAVITLDALTGQSFTGTVTDIDTSGTNSGGNTKFTAEITIERTDAMLAGMNASVLITLDTTGDVLVIPEAALVEEGSTTYVYTSYDEKSDTLGDLVEVETGVSDGTNVEICSGLTSGDSFYYSYAEALDYTFVSGNGTWG